MNKKKPKTIYCSIVYSHLLNGILAWGSDCKTTIKPFQMIQNKIIRIINNVRHDSHVKNNSLYFDFGILKIEEMHKLEIAKFMHMYDNNKLPCIFNEYFKTLTQIHKYNTRNHNNTKYY